MGVDWGYFNKFQRSNDMYLPRMGEGDTLATQLVTAVTKLVYKWYNDGDVFDNTKGMSGWANDLSDYANWLYKYIPSSRNILNQIDDCFNDDDYEELLKDLADALLDDEDLENLNQQEKQGSIYDCSGPYHWEWPDEDEDDDEWDDDYDEEDW